MNINKCLDKLDVKVIIQDTVPTYNPKGNKKQDNIECLFALDRHDAGHDHSKSMTINTAGEVYCHACGYKATNIIWLYNDILKCKNYTTAAKYLIDKYIEPLVDTIDITAANTKLMHSPIMLERLKMLRGFTQDTIKKYMLGLYNDRITIPVKNEYGFYCNIRLYDLLGIAKTKILSFKEGYGSAKLYPYSAFDIVGNVYIFEGETDCLLARQLGLNGITTTGGASTWKSEWDEYFIKRDVIIVPDMDKPGLEGCEKRARALIASAKTVSIIKLPVEVGHKDFTDYIVKEKHTLKDFLKLPKEKYTLDSAIVKPAEKEEEVYADIKMSSTETTYLNNADYLLQQFQQLGGFFKDQNHNLFFAKNTGQVFPVKEKNQNFLSELVNISPAVNPSTTNGKFIIQHIKNKAHYTAKEVKSGSWTLYSNDALYVFLNKYTGKIIKFTKDSSTILDNGLNDDSILLEYPDLIEILDSSSNKIANSFSKLKSLVFDNIAMKDEDRLHIIVWTLSTFFRNLANARPIVRLEASTAAGKSTITKILSTLLYGQEFLQHASTMASIYTVAAKYPLLMFDNIETRNMTNDFQDFLLIASTGGSRIKRQLHTDTGFISETADCMVLTNGIEPYVKNEIISRTLMLRVDVQKYGVVGFNLNDILYTIKQNRSDILFPILKYLCTKVLSNKKDIQKNAISYGKHAKERFNEYYGLAKIILEAVWPYINIPGYSPSSLVENWLNKQTQEHMTQSVAVNDVTYYFNTLALRYKTLLDLDSRITVSESKVKIRGQVTHILSDFRILAKQLGIKCPWESHRHLAARIMDSKKTLEKDGWDIKKIKSSGRMHYVFAKEEESLKAKEKDSKTKTFRI